MKYFRIITGLLAIATFASCSKDLTIKDLDFSVSADKATYKVGDTVHFTFGGNADIISLFSGEEGNNYAFRDRVTVDGKPQLEFNTYAQYGNQTNTLSLLVSNNFSGTYSPAGVAQATWSDLTAQANLSTGANNTPSGVIDLSDILAQKKPVYLAFKYTGVTGSTQKTWTITNLTLNLVKTNGKVIPVTDLGNAGFTGVDILNPAAKWSANASQLRISGGGGTAADNEDWIITKLLYLNSVSPDVSVPVKNITQKINDFSYVFSQPGNYKVVFLAANATADQQESTTREIDLTIQ